MSYKPLPGNIQGATTSPTNTFVEDSLQDFSNKNVNNNTYPSDSLPLMTKPSHNSALNPLSQQTVESPATLATAQGAVPSLKVIKLVGIPESGEGPGIPSPKSKADEDPKQRFVDIVDASNDDPFTLDSYENLMRLHAQRGKDFILARVTTADPQDPSKFYYSYYAAHHINKVLFRTQPEEGLLHRMCARNPLNNMTIVGDVLYYVVTVAAINAIEKAETKGSPTKTSPVTKLTVSKSKTLKQALRLFTDANETGLKKRTRQLSTDSCKLNSIHPPPFQTPIDVQAKQPGLNLFGVRGKHHPILQFVINPNLYERDEKGKYLYKRSPVRRESGLSRELKLQDDSSPHHEVRHRRRFSGSEESSEKKLALSINTNIQTHPNTNGKKELLKPCLSAPEMPSPAFQLHISSVCNDTETDLQSEGIDHVVDRWLEVRAQKQSPISATSTHSNPLEKSGPSSSSPSPEKMASPSLNSPPQSPSKPQTHTYIAHFLATDDDFLMKSRIRQFFRENALEVEDAQLFSISASTHNIVNINDLDPHPALFGMHYTISDSQTGSHRQWRGCISQRTFKWFSILYIILGIVLIKMVVPDKYIYLVAFMLGFFLCLILILCVECDV